MTKITNMLVGCLLGDAHIRRTKEGKAYITFEQTVKHKSYLLSIHNILSGSPVSVNSPKTYNREDKRHSSVNSSIYFRTESTNLLNYLADLFLSSDNKKIILDKLEEYLDIVALAYWICDDGQLVKRGGITLCTDSYTLSEVELLIKILENKFNLKCSIHKKLGRTGNIYYRIYIGKKSFDQIIPLLAPHVHESFQYKLHK